MYTYVHKVSGASCSELCQSRNNTRSPHPAESAESLEHFRHEEARLLRVGERRVEQVVDEVAAGLDGEHHAGLQRARRAQTPDARLVDALHALQDTHTQASKP